MRRRFAIAVVVAGLSSSAAAEPSAPKPTHVYSRGVTTWIYPTPEKSSRHRLGYVRLGEGIRLRSGEPQSGPGCSAGFYPVEPFGWVCADRTATFRMQGRYLPAMQLAHSSTGLMPFHYALSNGAPMYRRLPSRTEWEKFERFLGKRGSFRPQAWGNRGHEKLAEVKAIAASDPVPWFLADGGSVGKKEDRVLVRRTIPHGSMLSYTRAFSHEGRTWLLSADGTVVPADRVRPFRVSQFHGTELGKGVELPIAFFREKARPKYRKTAEGFEPAGGQWAVRTFVALDAGVAAASSGKKSFLATREKDSAGRVLWTDEADATLIEKREQRPIGVAEGEKWLLISITAGTLVAYDGERPVYATLASPGVGGVPMKGKDPVKMSTTPMGVYRVTFKHRAATMSPEQGENRSFWIADVPYTQYFNAPFALHTAYWHESFGEPMSAGCINLSPIDGRYLFELTDPQVPPGWNGAAPEGPLGKGTYVVVSR